MDAQYAENSANNMVQIPGFDSFWMEFAGVQ